MYRARHLLILACLAAAAAAAVMGDILLAARL